MCFYHAHNLHSQACQPPGLVTSLSPTQNPSPAAAAVRGAPEGVRDPHAPGAPEDRRPDPGGGPADGGAPRGTRCGCQREAHRQLRPVTCACNAPWAAGNKLQAESASALPLHLMSRHKRCNGCLPPAPSVMCHVHTPKPGPACRRSFLLLCLQRDYRLHGQEVLWFLITDSTTIRREVRECVTLNICKMVKVK